MRHTNITFEVCTETPDGVIAARQAGAQRIELTSSLLEGGLTPSLGLVEFAVQSGIETSVMIRPRGGDFVFSKPEVQVMRRDVELVKRAGAHGVVIGALTPDADVDVPLARDLLEVSKPMTVTFHRAFDLTRDPLQALEVLIELGVHRVLTSGQARTALEGAALIQTLVERAEGRLRVMAGAGINPANARRIVEATGVRDLHFSASEVLEFADRSALNLGSSPPPDGARRVTSARLIAEVISSLRD